MKKVFIKVIGASLIGATLFGCGEKETKTETVITTSDAKEEITKGETNKYTKELPEGYITQWETRIEEDDPMNDGQVNKMIRSVMIEDCGVSIFKCYNEDGTITYNSCFLDGGYNKDFIEVYAGLCFSDGTNAELKSRGAMYNENTMFAQPYTKGNNADIVGVVVGYLYVNKDTEKVESVIYSTTEGAPIINNDYGSNK